MTATTSETPPAPTPNETLSLSERLSNNPVVLKEMRGRMRGNRAFVLLTVYLVILSGLALLLYASYTSSSSTPFGADAQFAGKILFFGIVFIELLAVCFITPAFTSNAISGERERQTYDLLRTTLLPARSLVLGKLTSALGFIILLLIAAVPLQGLAFLLGGVAFEELAISLVMLLVTALAYGAMGIFFSTLMRRTLGASVLSYGFALVNVLALPMLAILILPILGVGFSQPNMFWLEVAFYIIMWVLVSLNPVAAGGVTALLLIEEQTLLLAELPLSSASYMTNPPFIYLPLPSPWLIYTAFYLLFGLGVIVLSIMRVRRKDD